MFIGRSRRYKSDGENTTKRFSLNAQKRFNQSRKVLHGYPWEGHFKTTEEVDKYLDGDRVTCLLCGKDYITLGTHLLKIHRITVDQYKEKYGIPWGRSLACSAARERMSVNLKRRIENGEFLNPPEEQEKFRQKAIKAQKRKKCAACVKDQVDRGTEFLKKYNAKHLAKPKPNPTPKSEIAAKKRAELAKRIVEMCMAGKTNSETSKTLNCATNTVKRRLKEAGVSRSQAEIKKQAEKTKALVIHLKKQGKLQIKEIADQAGISKSRVDQIWKDYKNSSQSKEKA